MHSFLKRTLSFILALSLVAGLIPAAFAYENVSDWAQESVDIMDENYLIPDSLYGTDMTEGITRLDMCRIALRTYENLTDQILDTPARNPFHDTDDEDALKAFAVGLVKGDGTGRFNPDQILTRVEFFCFVNNLLNAAGYPISQADFADLSSFSDAATVPAWAKPQTQLTVGLGIVQGTGGALSHSAPTTAEQAVTMFCRAYLAAREQELDPPQVEIITEAFQYASDWALYDYLYPMESEGLIPEELVYSNMSAPITRGEMCKVAIQTYKVLTGLDKEMDGMGEGFTDTSDPDITLAHFLGIVNGYQDGSFKPDAPISRQELFQITVNFLNALGYPLTDDAAVDLSQFKDYGELYDYAKPTTRLLVGLGLVKGDNFKKLNPRMSIVREEALVIFYRAYNFVCETPPDPPLPPEPTDRDPETEALCQAIVDLAISFVGKYPYISGGESPSEGGFDCSGLVQYCYKTAAGIDLPRTTKTQWLGPGVEVSKGELLVGDILFFSNDGSGKNIGHVGLYIGDGKFVHAANSKDDLKIDNLNSNYYIKNWVGAKRVLE